MEFLDRQIIEHEENGRDEVVVAHDSQMRALLMPLLVQPLEEDDHDFYDPRCVRPDGDGSEEE